MPRTGPFDKYPERYEQWFERNYYIYRSELNAVREMLPGKGRGVEIGVGSGRFAVPAGIKFGVEPSAEMRKLAEEKGIEAIEGAAENLPLEDESFDFALMVTTLCFLDDVERSFREVYRIIKPGGYFVNGFVDRDSPAGKLYQGKKEASRFYREAVFRTAGEIVSKMEQGGFGDIETVRTLFGDIREIDYVQPVEKGSGEGSFVVIRGRKEQS